jgi:hypothetical protein
MSGGGGIGGGGGKLCANANCCVVSSVAIPNMVFLYTFILIHLPLQIKKTGKIT